MSNIALQAASRAEVAKAVFCDLCRLSRYRSDSVDCLSETLWSISGGVFRAVLLVSQSGAARDDMWGECDDQISHSALRI